MAAPLKKEKVDQIISLAINKKTYKEISNITGVSLITVSRKVRAYNRGEVSKRELNKKKLQELKDKIAADRVVMKRYEVAKKYGLSESYIAKLINDHPLSNKFIVKRNYDKPKKPKVIRKREQAIQNIKKDYPSLSVDAISEKWGVSKRWVSWIVTPETTKKPHEAFFKTAKPKPEPKITPAKPKLKKESKKSIFLDPKDVIIRPSAPKRPVIINSKTTIYVRLDDKRSTDQIISDYNKKYNL